MNARLLIIFIALFVSSTASGQSLQAFLSTDNRKLIEDAVTPAFSIIRQEFQLQDERDGQKYNLDSLSYFGLSEAVCVNIVNGFIAPEAIMHPWKFDGNISSYPGYKPVLSRMSEYERETGTWISKAGPSFENYREIENSERVIVRDTSYRESGLTIDDSTGPKDGWLVWVYREENQLIIKSFRQKLDFNDTTAVASVRQPEDGDAPVMGVCLCTDCPEVGTIRFKLSAIVEQFSDGWKAISLAPYALKADAEHNLVAAPETQEESATPQSEKKSF